MGRHGLRFCREHGLELERIAREFMPSKKPSGAKPVKPKPQSRTTVDKLPIAVRVERLTAFVAAAEAPVSRLEAAKAAGLESAQGSIARVIKRAVELGLVEVRRGGRGGLVAGLKAPVRS